MRVSLLREETGSLQENFATLILFYILSIWIGNTCTRYKEIKGEYVQWKMNYFPVTHFSSLKAVVSYRFLVHHSRGRFFRHAGVCVSPLKIYMHTHKWFSSCANFVNHSIYEYRLTYLVLFKPVHSIPLHVRMTTCLTRRTSVFCQYKGCSEYLTPTSLLMWFLRTGSKSTTDRLENVCILGTDVVKLPLKGLCINYKILNLRSFTTWCPSTHLQNPCQSDLPKWIWSCNFSVYNPICKLYRVFTVKFKFLSLALNSASAKSAVLPLISSTCIWYLLFFFFFFTEHVRHILWIVFPDDLHLCTEHLSTTLIQRHPFTTEIFVCTCCDVTQQGILSDPLVVALRGWWLPGRAVCSEWIQNGSTKGPIANWAYLTSSDLGFGIYRMKRWNLMTSKVLLSSALINNYNSISRQCLLRTCKVPGTAKCFVWS